ncbi:MAG: glycosyltransferase family 4 protein [Phycisphaerae bacterium]|nr:glycosyltransferase family 4 protein [Phycisphaerae bacterium]
MFKFLLQDLSPITQGLIAMATSAIICLLLGIPMRRLGVRLRIMDVPNRRSSHSTPIPRMGGVAIVLAMIFTMALLGKPNPALLVAMAFGALVSIISFIDDAVSLSSVLRLLVHLGAACVSIYLIRLHVTGFALPFVTISLPSWVGFGVAVLFVAGFVNFFNFMDGINGSAAMQGIVGGATLSVLLALNGAGNSAMVAAALVGGCIGFLPYNFPRAVMFLGDMGATTIGFTLAMMTLIGTRKYPWIACVLPLGLFIYDAVFTICKRLLRGENVLNPHREFHFHLLIRCGWSHVRVTSLQVGLMLLCSAASLTYAWVDNSMVRLIVLLAVLAMLVTYSIFVHRYFARHEKKEEPHPAPTPVPEPADVAAP